jgi:3-deoxy-D-manno-octulosonic acid kinase
LHAPGVTAFAAASALEWLRQAVADGGTLHGWAEAREHARELSGRGVVYAVPAPTPGPDRRPRWAVRHYRRGGALGPLLSDRYLAVGESRPVREAAAAATLRERGIPTPAVVAGATYGTGVFYRADLVTELVPDGTDLAAMVFGAQSTGAGPPAATGGAEDALRSAGRLVARMGSAGVEHADLNAKNILLTPGRRGPKAFVLDLDRCGVVTPGGPGRTKSMRRRLERSLRKLEGATGRLLRPSEWEALRDGVEGGRP